MSSRLSLPVTWNDCGAVVFAATRSLDEFALTQSRRDAVTIWGVGCHPGVEVAQRSFNRKRFADLITETAFVSEVGLEGRSKVPVSQQEATFRDVLAEVALRPRLTSIHSSGAHARVLDMLAETPIRGAILHWWRGTSAQTARAIELDCWFSLNAASMKNRDLVAPIPLDRILTETDHPSGDREAPNPRQPGRVATPTPGHRLTQARSQPRAAERSKRRAIEHWTAMQQAP